MKKRFIALSIILLLMAGVQAQNGSSNPACKVEKTYEQLFDNMGNTQNVFCLESMGDVIIRKSKTNNIRCIVKVVTYGTTAQQAKERMSYIKVSTQGPSTLNVSATRGLINKKHYNIVTTVYLPDNVSLQHNENPNINEMVYRIINTFRNQ